ncbi:MAG: hypothetical protein M3O71_22860 [Bacteroidota bacterium]|nr:hypothetical protein [Bacteroidota bacterium]
MITPISVSGYWNFPNNRNQTAGTFTFDPQNKAELKLLGHLDGGNEYNVLLKEKVIHGFTADGKEITLLDCTNNGTEMSIPGIPTISYQPGYIIIGTYIEDQDQPLFNEIEVELELLTKWVDIWGFRYGHENKEDYFKIEYHLPENIQFEIDSNVDGFFSFAGSSNRRKEEEFVNSHKTKLKIKSKQLLTISNILEYAWHFKKFLTISTQSNTYFKKIILRSNLLNNSYNNIEHPKDIQLLYYQRELELKSTNQHSIYFLFTYLDIAHQFQAIINNWFSKKALLQPVVDIVYEGLSNSFSFLENDFLSNIQALEVFHRRCRQQTELLKQQHSLVWSAIINNLPTDQADYINKFEYAYEPGLTQRLKDLIKEFKTSTIDKLLGTNKQTKEFIYKTVLSRNFYTHYDLSLKEKALKGAPLHYTTEKLKALLLVAILSEIGFDFTQVEKMLARVEQHKYHFLLKR